MIGFLLFISVSNLVVSIFISPPKSKDGYVYFTRYTNLSFKLTLLFGVLAILF